jgi:hypothetical protein
MPVSGKALKCLTRPVSAIGVNRQLDSTTDLLPSADDSEAIGDNQVKRLIGVNYCMSTLWKGVLELILDLMTGCPLKILRVSSRLDAGGAGSLRRPEKQQASLRRHAHSRKNLENSDMPNAINNEVVPRLKTRIRKNITTKPWRIALDVLLAEVLQRLSVGRIAT